MRNSLHPPVTRTEPLHIKLQTNPRVSKRTRVKRNSSRGRLARPRDTLRPRRFRTAPTCTQFRITPRIRRGPFQPQFTDSKILVVPAVGIEFRFTPSQTTIMAGCASPWSWQDANVTFLRCSSAAPAVALRPGSWGDTQDPCGLGGLEIPAKTAARGQRACHVYRCAILCASVLRDARSYCSPTCIPSGRGTQMARRLATRNPLRVGPGEHARSPVGHRKVQGQRLSLLRWSPLLRRSRQPVERTGSHHGGSRPASAGTQDPSVLIWAAAFLILSVFARRTSAPKSTI
jgi:hypothetical protein